MTPYMVDLRFNINDHHLSSSKMKRSICYPKRIPRLPGKRLKIF